jgi:predicted phage baseplate assembly protein
MMTLETPTLDDRKFQDIVTEARSKIPLLCPKWTDYNLSDPGITLIEIFAWMVDMLLYRLNRVPDKNYIKFMDLIGIRLEPPRPASANVTFRLSASQPEPVTIPRGTEVATVRTETQDAIAFSTDEDLTIILPSLGHALTTPDNAEFRDVLPELRNPDRQTAVFEETPREGNALYLGYTDDLKGHAIGLTIESSVEGIGVDPRHPPLVWEYWDGEQEKWSSLRQDADTTGGLNSSGHVILHVPSGSAMREVDGRLACWMRCRATAPRPGQSAYTSSPQVRSMVSESVGGTTRASHALRVEGELLGTSDGSPGQRFRLQNPPILQRQPGETVEVETENEGEFEAWQEVDHFADSGPDDAHFTADCASGEIVLGPSVRQSTGEERQYGRVPALGRQIRFTSYRHGGGAVGNVGEGTLTVLKSSVPYVATVLNAGPARGGADAESLDSAKLRAPRVVAASPRAVTAEDYERLALEASPRVARAKCIAASDMAQDGSPAPGTVRVMLVPTVDGRDPLIPMEELELTRGVRAEVQAYLDERRLLATRLEITTPGYVPVAVAVRMRARTGSDRERVAEGVEKALYRFINPIEGGMDGAGWEFGRSLSQSEVYAVLQRVSGVDYVEEVSLYPVDAETGERGGATATVAIPPQSVLCSHRHEVTVV